MISVTEYIGKRGFEYRKRGDEAVMNCPFCDDTEKKFAINLKEGTWNCLHLNGCGERGNFYELQKRLGDHPERSAPKLNFVQKQKIYKLPQPKVQKLSSPAVDYLKSRKLTDETIEIFKIRTKDGAIAFPYYRDGVVTNVKYMAIERDGKGKKKMWSEEGAEPTLFNRDNIYGNELTICEGEIDCMTLVQFGIEAVSVPMGAGNFEWVEREWDFVNLFKKINICFDQDEAGQKATVELVQKIGSWRSHVVTLPFNDVNECLCMGVDEKTLKTHFSEAKDYAPSSLTNPSSFADEIHALFENPNSLNGIETPWVGVNEILKGWRYEELTVWSGRSGAGKSTILNQVILGLAAIGEKSCVASLEMPAKRYLRWAVIQYLENTFPHRSRVDSALEYFDDKIYIVNTFEEINPKDLLDVFEYAARRHSVKHFFIDSLMRISLPSRDELIAQREFISSLVSFAKKFTCHIHLVAHPRKGASDSDKPGKSDVSGSGNITNLAHNVIVIWRTDPETIKNATACLQRGNTPDILFSIKKNREFGTEGSVKLWFDANTKKYSDKYTEVKKQDTR